MAARVHSQMLYQLSYSQLDNKFVVSRPPRTPPAEVWRTAIAQAEPALDLASRRSNSPSNHQERIPTANRCLHRHRKHKRTKATFFFFAATEHLEQRHCRSAAC